jgi:hypothetical protein
MPMADISVDVCLEFENCVGDKLCQGVPTLTLMVFDTGHWTLDIGD